jgi:hypothetical protein
LKNIIEFNVGSNVINTELNPNVAAFENVICCVNFAATGNNETTKKQQTLQQEASSSSICTCMQHMAILILQANLEEAGWIGSLYSSSKATLRKFFAR